MKMKPELVAPAGDFDSLKAAVHNGADAVYLGGQKFNARIHAKNFGDEELRRAVRYAHDHGVKVYVTVNTLVADRELCELHDYLTFLHHLEADAVIVQDIGVLKLCRELHSGLRVHGSTQMTIHNAAGVKFLAEQGVKRVTLARELSLSEIRRIKEECSGVEVEVFAHGTLCFSYSGQCLMSSFFGGRSANRGRCASPCRLPYSIVGKDGTSIPARGPFLLSMRDLNLSDDVSALVSAQVDALKIEGRMKTPEYVAVVTGIYRRIIDEERRPTPVEKKDLEAIFNRGFTKGYLYSHPGSEAISCERPGNYGVDVGVVTRYEADTGTASILLTDCVRARDGLEFETSSGSRGLVVTKLSVKGRNFSDASAGCVADVFLPFQPLVNTRVRKSRDSDLHRRAESTFTQPDQVASAGNGRIFVGGSKGYEQLSALLITPRSGRIRKAHKICVEVSTLTSLSEAVQAGVDEVYFGGFLGAGRPPSLDDYIQALDVARGSGVPLAIAPPRIVRDGGHWGDWVRRLVDLGADAFLVGDVGMLETARQLGVKVYLDSSFNVFNRLARNLLFNYASRITLSQELHPQQIARIAGGSAGEVEFIVHGHVTLMVSEQCPVSNVLTGGDKTSCRKICYGNEFFLKDRKGALLPVKCDEASCAHILYSRDLCLIDFIPELKAAGVDVFRIRGQNYPDMIGELVRSYRAALSVSNDDAEGREGLIALKEKLRSGSGREFSRGRLRGVE